MSLKSGAASADKLVDVFLNNSFIRAAALTSIAVGGYMPIGSEINCVPLLKAMFDGGVNICLPIIQNKGATLLFRGWEPDDNMHLNSLGVPEPLPSASLAIPDVLLVPMLAFDKKGYRLGYGKGFYDKFFEKNKNLVYLGYGYEFQEVNYLTSEHFDLRCNAIITDKSIKVFKL